MACPVFWLWTQRIAGHRMMTHSLRRRIRSRARISNGGASFILVLFEERAHLPGGEKSA